MSDFPYTTNSGKIKPLLDKVKSSGKPDSVTFKTLQTWGFKSPNDRPLLTILKFIGFLDSSGTPTPIWSSFRSDQTGKIILAQAIRTSYSDLFKLYPDANRKDNEALRHYFSTNTSVGADTLNFILATFRRLCDLADFEAEPVETTFSVTSPVESASASIRSLTTKTNQGFILNLNIQLTLPATENASIYENLFSAMKKHLLS